jgi:hypothetical protein
LLQLVAVTSLLAGCGDPATQPSSAFVNQTRHSDAQLGTIWHAAQQNVSHQIDLNPVQRTLYGAAPDIRPGDPRALSLRPDQLQVTAEPDVPSAVLLAATGIRRNDPTGMIACPQPCHVRFAAAYSRYRPPLTKFATSWESRESDFQFILEYEFENQVLYRLGYDMTWR